MNAEMISALRIHLTPVKTCNRGYKCWVRPDEIRRPGHCITTTAWHGITSLAFNGLKNNTVPSEYFHSDYMVLIVNKTGTQLTGILFVLGCIIISKILASLHQYHFILVILSAFHVLFLFYFD